jgi:hypothetical protein
MTSVPDSTTIGNQRLLPNTVAQQPLLARIAPAVGLVILAPLVGELLLGNVPAASLPWSLIFLAPMYGGGALLIREVTRRSGHGWSTMMLLATAYGVLQPALLDQGLFNPSYSSAVDFQSTTPIPGAGFSAYWAQTFVVGHAIWSIGVPIAIMEALVPRRSTTPWLGKVGLMATTTLFLFGSWIIFQDHQETYQFMASPPQILGTVLVVLTLIVGAFALPKNTGPKSDKAAPTPWVVGITAFILTSIFILREESWIGTVFGWGLLLVLGLVMHRWSRRQNWGLPHQLALAGGTLLTYAWLGFFVATLLGQMDMIQLIGNIALTLGAIGLLAVGFRRVQAVSRG